MRVRRLERRSKKPASCFVASVAGGRAKFHARFCDDRSARLEYLRGCEMDHAAIRSALPRFRAQRSVARRPRAGGGEDDPHLLSAVVPRAQAEARERSVLPLARCGRTRWLPGVPSLPPGSARRASRTGAGCRAPVARRAGHERIRHRASGPSKRQQPFGAVSDVSPAPGPRSAAGARRGEAAPRVRAAPRESRQHHSSGL